MCSRKDSATASRKAGLVDPESVRRRLREIDRRIQSIRQIEQAGRETFLVSDALRAQAERHLQLVIQGAIDIAVHILAEDSARTPEDYGSAFAMLGEEGVLSPDLADALRSAAGLRNILVHGYLEVDPGRLWEHFSRLDDFTRFAEAIESYLKG